ncbi:MAG TPA: tetratricopeptide repeat protein [Polyangiaceae bacterium]|nr:tetratricopeptide repeat protein [Polyangiaceae bacterium]
MAELTIEDALAFAIQLHQDAFRARDSAGLLKARTVYERILEAVPEHADALHFLGVLLHQIGETEGGLELIARAMLARPNDAMMYNNLGNVLTEKDRHEEAAVAYRRAIELGYQGADAESNLGVSLKAVGDLEAAMAAFRRALALDPRHAASHGNLGGMLFRARRYPEAISHLQQAIALEPRFAPTRRSLALALYRAGRQNEAVASLRAWLEVTPGQPEAVHFLAAFSQQNVPGRASDGFVRNSFDALATRFDEHLRDLGYRAPELLAAAIAPELGVPDGGLDVLDAGCGTGLCAASLRPYAKRLSGVDLSPAMLELAERRGGYDELVEAELTTYIEARPAQFDLIVSADTLCYFGDLAAVLAAARRALRARGVLAFSVERSPRSSPSFWLQPHGRYSHATDYVQRALTDAGFELRTSDIVTLRLEAGEPVVGLVVVAVAA